MTGHQQQEAVGASDATATAVSMQGILDGQTIRPNPEKAIQGPGDTDIFDALFSKWGQDAANEEANMGSSFDDLLWDETTAAAAAAAAAASFGWQRSCTPFNLLSSSRVAGSEQQQQQLWEQAMIQQQQQMQQQDKQFAREYLQSSSLVASGASELEQDMQKQQQQSRSVGRAQPAHSNSCSDQKCRTHATAVHASPAVADVKPELAVAAGGLQCSVQAMQQLLAGGSAVPEPAASAAPPALAPQQQANATAAAAGSSQELLNAFHTAQQQLNLQQMQFSAAFKGSAAAAPAAGGEAGTALQELPAMLQLQQQLLLSTQAAQQVPQPQPQQAYHQQQPVPMNSVLSHQLSSQPQQQQQAPSTPVSSWACGIAGASAGMGALPNSSIGGFVAADAVLQGNAWAQALQQQQQQVGPAGLPAGLPFPGAGPGPGPGLGLIGNLGLSNPSLGLANSAPFGIPNLSGANTLGDQAALYAAAIQAAQQAQLMQQRQILQQHEGQQQQQQQQVAQQGSSAMLVGAVAGNDHNQAALQQSLSALLGANGGATAAAGHTAPAAAALGTMGPPPPHAPNAAAAAAAGIGGMLPLPQQHVQAPQPLQPMLPPELLHALGLGQGLAHGLGPGFTPLPNPGLPGLAGLPGFPPNLPASWPLQLAGLLRPPPVQTTSFLQLALIMQAAMHASALSTSGGGGEMQQAAMLVAALQGLAGNMRMLMPWSNPPAWPQQPQPQQLNGSCLANGHVLHRQLSSSYGAGGQKATLQFGSQPQTSTTDISGHGLPGCHSHSTAVGAGGERGEAAHRVKHKRKVRHNDNRARYEGRKIRANNRLRVKGRFVKVGPNGEPILPGDNHPAESDNHPAMTRSGEQHTAVTHSGDNHTAITHSGDHHTANTHSGDHDGSDADHTDTETHDHPDSSCGRPPAPAAADLVAAVGGSPHAGVHLVLPQAVQMAAAANGFAAAAPQLDSGLVSGFRVDGGGTDNGLHVMHGTGSPCCADAVMACVDCHDRPAAHDSPRRELRTLNGVVHEQDERCHDGHGLFGEGHAVHDSSKAAAVAPDGSSPLIGAEVDAQAGGLEQQQQCVLSAAAVAQGPCNCLQEPHAAAASLLDATAAGVAGHVQQGSKRSLAATECPAGDLCTSESKRQAIATQGSITAAAMVTPAADTAGGSCTLQTAADVVQQPADYGAYTPMQGVQEQLQKVQPAAAANIASKTGIALDPAEAAAAMVSAGVVEQQHQILVRQASEAAAAAAAAVEAAQTEAAAEVPDVDGLPLPVIAPAAADVPAPSAVPQHMKFAAALSQPPAAGAVGIVPPQAQHPAAALLSQLAAAGGSNALQQWQAAQAFSQVLNPALAGLHNGVPAHVPGNMHPPAARPPAGFWGHQGVARLSGLSPAGHTAHNPLRPGVGGLGPHLTGLQPQGLDSLLAAAPFAAMQPAGVGPAVTAVGCSDQHQLHMGLSPWALQQHLLGAQAQHLLPPGGHLASGSVGIAGLPLVQPNTAALNGVQQMLGPQLVPVALPGGWPLAAAVAGKWVPPKVARQRRRGGKAKDGSEQTDSCLN